MLDPDVEVQTAIRDVFASFAAGGSAYAAVAAFVGRRFPLRAYGGVWAGQLRWGKLTHARVLGVLSNPCYAGTYVYGRYATRRTVEPDGTVRTGVRLLPRDQWPVVLHDHHEGYITWQNFLGIEAKLKANCTHDGARPAREGLALCQGIIGCGSCGRPMTTRYHRGGQAAYECSGSKADHQGTPTCRSIRADVVDDAVAARLLARLTSDQITVALAAADEVTTRHTRVHRAAELAVERARYEADRAERAFTAVDPGNRLVVQTLESRWEARLTALAEAEAALTTARESRPSLPDRDGLLALATGLPRLWHAADTRDKDKKRLRVGRDAAAGDRPMASPCRLALAHWGERGGRSRTAQARAGGSADPVVGARADQPARSAASRRRDRHRTGGGRHHHRLRPPVRRGRGALGPPRPQDPLPVHGPVQGREISVKEVARRLVIAADAVYYLITHGQLAARKTPSGRWCVPWDEETEADCRRRIAESGHPTPKTRTITAGGAV
ncbi:recombinase family protein [Streptomyces sp. NBC_01017]|uniref:recombinase family protein n=1 Tax=Streptomyces sp. NBC_01017 TaxID=2903721 RepID=UPI00386BF255|nr:recombinase family protein [Streptomyces sp. NBC_01017]